MTQRTIEEMLGDIEGALKTGAHGIRILLEAYEKKEHPLGIDMALHDLSMIEQALSTLTELRERLNTPSESPHTGAGINQAKSRY